MSGVFVEASATVAPTAVIGAGTKVWHQAQVIDGVEVGEQCVIGKGVYLGAGTVIGNRVKIQNGCGVFGARLSDDAMLAPGVYLLEDPAPRATRPDGKAKGPDDWRRLPVTIHQGATLGANTTVAPGVTVGRYSMTAMGSAVHRDVPDHALIAGNPARQVGWVCACGAGLPEDLTCAACAVTYHKTPTGLRLAGQPALSESTRKET